jgi:hypothetical protein
MNAGDREPAADTVLADAESAVTGRLPGRYGPGRACQHQQ